MRKSYFIEDNIIRFNVSFLYRFPSGDKGDKNFMSCTKNSRKTIHFQCKQYCNGKILLEII